LRNLDWNPPNSQLIKAEAAEQGADATGLQGPAVAGR
jgi:hypothetical protein